MNQVKHQFSLLVEVIETRKIDERKNEVICRLTLESQEKIANSFAVYQTFCYYSRKKTYMKNLINFHIRYIHTTLWKKCNHNE